VLSEPNCSFQEYTEKSIAAREQNCSFYMSRNTYFSGNIQRAKISGELTVKQKNGRSTAYK
jgi:hypothetical protein